MDEQKPESSWRRWRHSRPFWGGLLVTLSGAEILATVKAPLPVILHVGMQGLAGMLVPVIILLCGVLLFANPAQRLFYSVVAAVMSLASWATSNLGGFIVGLLLGLVGSALAFAWAPRRAVPVAAATPQGTPDATVDDTGVREQQRPSGRHADVGLAITRKQAPRQTVEDSRYHDGSNAEI